MYDSGVDHSPGIFQKADKVSHGIKLDLVTGGIGYFHLKCTHANYNKDLETAVNSIKI